MVTRQRKRSFSHIRPLLAAVTAFLAVFPAPSAHASGIDGGYVGTPACLGCHDGSTASDKTDVLLSGHPYKLRMTVGTTPLPGTDPLSDLLTSAGGNTIASIAALNADASLPTAQIDADSDGKLDWAAVEYVIGGFGWKARWGILDSSGNDKSGYVWSAASLVGGFGAQFNMLAADLALDPTGQRADWSTYGSSSGQSKKYQCAICHNTNGTSSVDAGCTTALGSGRTEPWGSTGLTPGGNGFYSEWSYSGVQCEACHGPGGDPTNTGHADLGASVTQGVLTLSGGEEICAKCHIRAENTSGMGAECGGDANPTILTNGAKITGDYINHHEQYNELEGLNSDGVHNTLTCSSCHNAHLRAHKVTDAIATALGITDNDVSAETRGAVVSCDGCHPGKTFLRAPMPGVTCIDCHMAEATKTATNESPDGAWGRQGDVKTHVFKIDPAATTITRSNGYTNVVTNALSVRYACGKCHDETMADYVGVPATLAMAQEWALNIHDPAPPVYPVTFTTTVVPNSLQVNVDAQVDCGGTCSAFTYDWNWGDATAHGTADPDTHTYATGGTKSITLIVKLASNGDTVGSKTRSVTLANPDLPPTVGGACTWNANTWVMSVLDTSSDDGPDADALPGDGNASLQIVLDWGDGSAKSFGSQGGTLNHTYNMTGGFPVSQKAIDSKLQSASTLCAASATPSYFTITGTVKNKLGTKNLASATVQLRKSGTLVKTVYTATNGTFSATNLKPGAYTLTVTKSGYTFAVPAAAITVGPSGSVGTINATAP